MCAALRAIGSGLTRRSSGLRPAALVDYIARAASRPKPLSSNVRRHEAKEETVPKSTFCIVNGRPMDVRTALEIRSRKASAHFRCSECGEIVRPHKTGTTGQEAHFEHLSSNPRCSLSAR